LGAQLESELGKKKRKVGSRSKRMKRPARLQSAKMWIPTYTGKNLIIGYCKHFAVDFLCAVKELRFIGATIDEEYIARVLQAREQSTISRLKKKAKQEEIEALCSDSDDNFFFIAGYTSWEFPYGLTWEEARVAGIAEAADA
jgi:hypothetical protein